MKSLLREGVDTIFGYPGGAIMPVYDALYDYKDSIRHVLVRHEQGAAHAAEGYSRLAGKPGVCMVTSGPGATNLVTGIADAMCDSIPIVCITGQVAEAALGTDISGSANYRHCDAGDKVVLSDNERGGNPAHCCKSISYRERRQERPRAHRHHKKCAV